MRNRIVNLTATGAWQAPEIGHNVLAMKIQARTSAEVQIRYDTDSSNYFTIKTDTSHALTGRFDQGDLWVKAAGAVIIEIECSGQGVFT